MSVVPENLADNLTAIRKRIEQYAAEAGRDSSTIKLIAVSKTRSLADIKQTVTDGQKVFGENTVQDAMTKIPQLAKEGIEWHFIGRLQSKKASDIPGNFQWIHSINRIKLAKKLSDALVRSGIDSLNCLIQVNLSEETTKSGLIKSELYPFIQSLLEENYPGLNWRGLMTMGVDGDMVKTRVIFRELRNLRDETRNVFDMAGFDQLSMGMSGDYRVAIEEGSTMLRIGAAIFGARN